MGKKLITAILVLLGLVVVVVITIISTTYSANHDLSLKIYKEAQVNKNFDSFVRYQTKLGKQLTTYSDDIYDIYVYYVVVETKEGYLNQLLIIIDADDTVKHATHREDPNDKMSVVVTSDNLPLGDTKADDHYKGYALSYGFSDSILGFVYIGFDVLLDGNLSISITDYDGNIIVTIDTVIDVIDYKPDDVETYTDYLIGYTVDDISALIGLEALLFKEVTFYISLYLGIVIVGLGIFIFVKKYLKHKNG
jgi:hypothetical protein